MSYYLPGPYGDKENADFQEYLRENPQILEEFADFFVITMPNPRIATYESSDLEIIRSRVTAYTKQIDEALGFFPI
jgi:hypothetical protein